MNLHKLLLTTTGVLLACQLGWSQTAATTPAQVQARVTLAARTGQAVPLVPAASNPDGFYRPHVWVAGALATPMGGFTPNLPSFCNKPRGGNGFQFCPNALQTTYGVPFKKTAAGTKVFDGTGLTIGIVDAFHYANADANLQTFNTTMGLPQCTIANGCFQQLDQNGGHNYCGANSGWELETMLDLEWAHAMAPGAKIVLVEGCDNSFENLGTAVTTATHLANIVSNSYGALEFEGETGYDNTYSSATVPVLFSSGDNGTPTSYPCASPYVTCVGGTSLQPDSVTFKRIMETGWSGSGGGCSSQEALPDYQANNGVNLCAQSRATPDVAADADPNTGAVVYDSGNGGYLLVGGTSLATPLTAGIYIDDMQARHTFNGNMDPDLYLVGCHGTANCIGAGQINPYYYFDVTAGSNGLPAVVGYDLVTGMGVSNGAHMGGLFGLP